MLQRIFPSLVATASLLATTNAYGDTIGPGFGVSGYSATATASAGLGEQSNTNTNLGGASSALVNDGGGGPVASIAGAIDADNAYQGEVFTNINGGFGAASASGFNLIDFRVNGAPAGSTTFVTLTFSEMAQIGASPPTPNGVATFDITSDFKLVGQTTGEAKVNAVGLYKNSQLSGSGALTGIIDPQESTTFDLFGSSAVTAQVSGNFVLQMTNEINVEVNDTGGLGDYNVYLTGLSLTNSAGAAVSVTPVVPTVPLPGALSELVCGLGLILVLMACRGKDEAGLALEQLTIACSERDFPGLCETPRRFPDTT
jgi:hypothetical protein